MKFEDYILDVSVKREHRKNKAVRYFKGIFRKICETEAEIAGRESRDYKDLIFT